MNSYDSAIIPEGIKKAELWTVDGSYYTDDIRSICRDLLVVNGKEFYTIRDDSGELLALATVRWN